ncbi:Kelch repeat-containing protein [Bdellovibrio bacteriovorus]|uniref:Kelch repeat-containing protein n=1 Tax=Bdellovibrio TaxID=958 RepID=UPI0035A93308
MKTLLLPSSGILAVAALSLTLAACKAPEDAKDLASNTSLGKISADRYGHTATRLQDGRVIITGGYVGLGIQSSEIFDPQTNQWTWGPQPVVASRLHANSLLLNDGRVLLVGGFKRSPEGGELPAREIEVYDPVTNEFTVAASMAKNRNGATVTLLNDGRVLILGGSYFDYENVRWVALDDGEIFNPVTNEIHTLPDRMSSTRTSHTAVLLPSGDVMVLGGMSVNGNPVEVIDVYRAHAEAFIQTNPLREARYGHSSFLLSDESVLSIGGSYEISNFRMNAEIYYSGGSTTVWTTLPEASFGKNALQLQNSKIVFVSSFSNAAGQAIYALDQTTRLFSQVGNISVGRSGYTMTELEDGSLLIVGGTRMVDGYLHTCYDVERIYLSNTNETLE